MTTSMLDDINRAARAQPRRPAVGLQVGTVSGEATASSLRVEVLGSDPVTVPALPGNYLLGGRVNVQWDTGTDRPLLVYGSAEPAIPGDGREVVVVGGELAGDRAARLAVAQARERIEEARIELDAAGGLIDAVRARVGREAFVPEVHQAGHFTWTVMGGHVTLTADPEVSQPRWLLPDAATSTRRTAAFTATTPGEYPIDLTDTTLPDEAFGATITLTEEMLDPLYEGGTWQPLTLPMDQLTAPGGALHPDVVAPIWEQIIAGGYVLATEGFIGPQALIDGAVTARALDVVAEAPDGTSWRLDENGFVALRADSSAALHLDETGLRAWNAAGVLTFSQNAATGDFYIVGRFDSAAPGQPGVSIIPNTDTTFQDAGVWISNSIGGNPGLNAAGAWVTAPAATSAKPMFLRGQFGGGVEARNGFHSAQGITYNDGLSGNGATSLNNASARLSLSSNSNWLLGNVSADLLLPRVSGSGSTLQVKGGGSVMSLANQSGAVLEAYAVHTRTTSAGPNVYVGTSGVLARSTSATRYKAAIEPVPADWYDRILDPAIVPETWIDKPESDRYAAYVGGDSDFLEPGEFRRIPGLLADAVEAAGLGAYVTYSEQGEIEGLMYDRLLSLLIPVARRHREQITDLAARVAALEA